MVRNGRETATGSPEERTPRAQAVVRVLGGFTANRFRSVVTGRKVRSVARACSMQTVQNCVAS